MFSQPETVLGRQGNVVAWMYPRYIIMIVLLSVITFLVLDIVCQFLCQPTFVSQHFPQMIEKTFSGQGEEGKIVANLNLAVSLQS